MTTVPTGRRKLKIGELARLSGKSVRALHLYEELGLLQPLERSKGGFRLYGTDAVTRVSWIAHLNDLGFSLSEIQEFQKDWRNGPSGPESMKYVRALYEQKLSDTRTQIERLKELEGELDASLRYLDTCGSTCDEHTHGVTSCAQCDVGEPDRAERSPALVAGLYKGSGELPEGGRREREGASKAGER